MCSLYTHKLNISVNVLLASCIFVQAFKIELCRIFFLGGFYLSATTGVQNRYTQDLDFKLSHQQLDENNIAKTINEIISFQAEMEFLLHCIQFLKSGIEILVHFLIYFLNQVLCITYLLANEVASQTDVLSEDWEIVK